MENEEEEVPIPPEGAVFTFGRTGFAENRPNKFWIKADPVVAVSCGDEHSGVLTASGRLFTFGSNEYGQLGHGNTRFYSKPSSVKSLKGKNVTLIAFGRHHSLVALEGGGCLAFGANAEGQLGSGDLEARPFPSPIPQLYQLPLKALAAGASHSMALTQSGAVYTWGSNREGQLGSGSDPEQLQSPQPLHLEGHIVLVQAGYYHSAFLASDGSVFLCGDNSSGQLGLGPDSEEIITRPTIMPPLSHDETVSAIASGWAHSLFLSSKGSVFGAGLNSSAQLGLAAEADSVKTATKLDLPFPKAVAVLAGYDHSIIIDGGGKVWTFGSNGDGKGAKGDVENGVCVGKANSLNEFETEFGACGGRHSLLFAKNPASSKRSLSLSRQQSLAREQHRAEREERARGGQKEDNGPLGSNTQPRLPPVAFSGASSHSGKERVSLEPPSLAPLPQQDPESVDEPEELSPAEGNSEERTEEESPGSEDKKASESVKADSNEEKKEEASPPESISSGKRKSSGFASAKSRFKNLFSRKAKDPSGGGEIEEDERGDEDEVAPEAPAKEAEAEKKVEEEREEEINGKIQTGPEATKPRKGSKFSHVVNFFLILPHFVQAQKWPLHCRNPQPATFSSELCDDFLMMRCDDEPLLNECSDMDVLCS